MPPRKPSRKPASVPRSSAAGAFVLGILFAAVVSAGAWWYLHRGPAPTHKLATRTPEQGSAPAPRSVEPGVATPVHPGIALPPAAPPFGTSEDVYEAGARLYARPLATAKAPAQSCASCHGSPARAGMLSPQTIPPAKHFFTPAAAPASPSQIFLRTKYGVAGSPAMPAYGGTLTDRQIWQIALLLANARQTLPDPVNKLLDARGQAQTR